MILNILGCTLLNMIQIKTKNIFNPRYNRQRVIYNEVDDVLSIRTVGLRDTDSALFEIYQSSWRIVNGLKQHNSRG